MSSSFAFRYLCVIALSGLNKITRLYLFLTAGAGPLPPDKRYRHLSKLRGVQRTRLSLGRVWDIFHGSIRMGLQRWCSRCSLLFENAYWAELGVDYGRTKEGV